MSEYQNKAVELMQMRIGDESASNPAHRRDAFIVRAIGLYHAMGGDPVVLQSLVEKICSQGAPRIDVAVGDVMYKLAGIGHAADLDIIQAAYNKLDQAMPQRAATKPPVTPLKSIAK